MDNKSQYLLIDIPEELNTSGMFSIFCYVTGALFEYEKNLNYTGLEINFQNKNRYCDPKYGLNWWEYFCEAVCIGNKENALIKKHTKEEYVQFTHITEYMLSRNVVHSLIQKYIKIKHTIQAKVSYFKNQKFTSSHIIGVHYRGTDKISEAILLPYHEILDHVQAYVVNNHLEDYQIFVASDERPFIEMMNKTFGNRIITYSSHHSDDSTPLHELYSNNYCHAEEALMDSLLLSKTDILFRTTSNLSLWSTFFNPYLKVMTLSERF